MNSNGLSGNIYPYIENLDLVCNILDKFNFEINQLFSKDKNSLEMFKNNIEQSINKIKDKLIYTEHILNENINNNKTRQITIETTPDSKSKVIKKNSTAISSSKESFNFSTPGSLGSFRKHHSSENSCRNGNLFIYGNEMKKKSKINFSEDILANEILKKNQFKPLAKIGDGGFSTVYKVKKIEDSNIYAMKIIDLKKSTKETILREVKALQNLINSRYIIKIFDYSNLNQEYDYILLQYIEGRTLGDIINDKSICLNLNQKFFIFIQIYYGICEMHFNGIIHRDLKLENIILDKSGQIFLLDFTSVIFYDDENNNFPDFVTKEYACPEALIKSLKSKLNIKQYTKFDVYSLGIILYRLIFDKQPYIINPNDESENNYKVVLSTMNDEINNYDIDDNLKTLLKMMLEFSNEKRITLSKIQDSEWFKNMTEVFKNIKASNLRELFEIELSD